MAIDSQIWQDINSTTAFLQSRFRYVIITLMQLKDLEPLHERCNCFVMLLQQCEADFIAFDGSHMTYDESKVFFMKIMYASTKLAGLLSLPVRLPVGGWQSIRAQ